MTQAPIFDCGLNNEVFVPSPYGKAFRQLDGQEKFSKFVKNGIYEKIIKIK